MVVGSGLIAMAMNQYFADRPSHCIFAAGVSNSRCIDPTEFRREAYRLTSALAALERSTRLVYFGTCSVDDPESLETPYVQHKLSMEALAREHGNTVIFRLPQVAGRTPNPHTLMNFLHARIARSERFTVWRYARRYIIHADDMARIACHLLSENSLSNATVNLAAPRPYSIQELIAAFETLLGKAAVFELADRGSSYEVDSELCQASAKAVNIDFGPTYLQSALRRVYGSPTPVR